MSKRNWWIAAFVLTLALLWTMTPPPKTTTLEGKAPEFSLERLDGSGKMQLKDSHGKLRLMVFWATWCAPCRAEIPALQEIQKKYGEKVQILGISVDEDINALKSLANQVSFRYPILLATQEFIDQYGGISVIPTTILVDKDGQVREFIQYPLNLEELEGLVQKWSP